MTARLVSAFVGLVWWGLFVTNARTDGNVTRISVLNPIYLIKSPLAGSSTLDPESNNNTDDISYSSDAYFNDTTESNGNISNIDSKNFDFNDSVSSDSFLITTPLSASLVDVPENGNSTSRVSPNQAKLSPTSTAEVLNSSSPPSLLSQDILNSVNFLRLMERNCTVAYLEVKKKQELPGEVKEKTSESCIVGFWHRGEFPLWLHQVGGEGLLDTLPRASDEQKNFFTEQLCPCRSVQVSKSCEQKVVDAMLPLIMPCFENEEDPDNSSDNDAHIIAKVQKAMKDIQLFNEAKLKLRSSQEKI